MFGAPKHHGTPIAVFDISSSSVAGAHALVHKSADKPSTILASVRIDAPLKEDLDIKRFVSDTIKSIESVASSLRKADLHKPSFIQLLLASPWYVSQTRTILYKKDVPFVYTKKLMNDLVDAEIQHVIKEELERFGAFGKEGIVVEKQVSLVKLNGYTTGSPLGKKATSVELFLTLTVVPKKVIDQFTEALRRTYGARPIRITTSPYATFVMARDFFHAADEAVIIDVGEEVTDVAFVKDGLFLYQHSFPVGTYGLYRALMGEGSHTAIEAKALVQAYRLEKTSATARKSVEKALTAFSERWQLSLQGVLEDGHYGFCLPQLCYITADPQFEGVFPAILGNDPFIQHACSRGVVTAEPVNAEKIGKNIVSLDTEFDVALASGVLYASRVM